MSNFLCECVNSACQIEKRRRLIWSIYLIASAFPVSAETPEVCRFFDANAEMVTQTLYMHQEDVSHDLKVPIIYFEDKFDRVNGSVHQGQLFSVMNEDFTPVTRPQTAALIAAGNWAYMTFVLHDKVPLEQVLGIIAGELDRKVGRDLANFEEIDAEFDLALVRPKRWRDNPSDIRDDKETFVGRDAAGDVSAVISCDLTDDPSRRPGCNQDFRAHGIDVRTNYRSEFLKDWRRLQTDISEFIGCAVNAASKQD